MLSLRLQLPLRSNPSPARGLSCCMSEPPRAGIETFGNTGYQDFLAQCPVKVLGKL